MQITVNGQVRDVSADPAMPLLWVLREKLELTGTKYGCGAGLCHACTVHIDGQAMQSCQTTVGDLEGGEVTTIEGLGAAELHPVQKAWIEHSVPQCGYCQSGVIMALASLIAREPQATMEMVDAEIQNICRCGTYPKMREALRQVLGA